MLALGKLGGREMTATSDLDLIIVYDFDEEHPQSDGARPLYGAQYFARLTQRLISALAAQTNYGALYQVDMRLRPSGRSGPVATRSARFASYQENEAWTWEHMALTRARVVSASPAFAARVEEVIRDVLCRQRDAGSDRRRRGRDARARSPRRRATASAGTSNTPPAGWSISNSSRNICSSCTRAEKPEILDTVDRARARQGGAAAACWRRRTPTCCARRCGSIRT